jgi:hypothetical protein
MLKPSKIVCFLLVILALTITVFAQPTTTKKPVNTAKIVQDAQDKAQRLRDEETVRKMEDPGFDLAVVVKDGAIRETAGIKGKLLSSVKRGDFLSLVEKEPSANWYKVVQADSGTEGWIDGKFVVIKLTANKFTGPPLEEEDVAKNLAPEVSITNLEEGTTLRIRLNGKLYMIPPGTTKTVQLTEGKFIYYGWSPGIRPATGNSYLQKGKKYSWRFKINRR